MAGQYPWKVAWITGASGAICGEIARRLAAAGVAIAATARPSEKLDQLAASSERIKPFPADVLKPDELKTSVSKIESALGPIDLALLGAGMYVPFDIRNIDLDGFHRTMALNVDGVINAVAVVLPKMLARSSGHIAIMGSLFGYTGWPENGSYGASKAAVINLVQTSAYQLAGSGIRVNAICPGLIETGMTQPLFDYARSVGKENKIGQLNPLRRGGQPDEIARVALFLSSDEASYVNGQAWAVDGGLSASLPIVPGRMA